MVFVFWPDVEFDVNVVFPCVPTSVVLFVCPAVTASDDLFFSGAVPSTLAFFVISNEEILLRTDLFETDVALKNYPSFYTGQYYLMNAEFTFRNDLDPIIETYWIIFPVIPSSAG